MRYLRIFAFFGLLFLLPWQGWAYDKAVDVVADDDLLLGSPDAEVIVKIYGSLKNTTLTSFITHNLSRLYARFGATGRLAFVFRNVDEDTEALSRYALLYCAMQQEVNKPVEIFKSLAKPDIPQNLSRQYRLDSSKIEKCRNKVNFKGLTKEYIRQSKSIRTTSTSLSKPDAIYMLGDEAWAFSEKYMQYYLPYIPERIRHKINPITEEEIFAHPELELNEQHDRWLGKKNAEVMVIEYSAIPYDYEFSFHGRIFFNFIQKYINSKKILYVHRPVFRGPTPELGAKTAYCVPKDRYFGFIGALHGMREEIIKDRQGVIRRVGNQFQSDEDCQQSRLTKQWLDALSENAIKKLQFMRVPRFIVKNSSRAKILDGRAADRSLFDVIDKMLREEGRL